MADLEDFARQHPNKTGPVGMCCTLPPKVLTEIKRGREQGIPTSIIAEWVQGEGHLTDRPGGSVRQALARHFRDKHDA